LEADVENSLIFEKKGSRKN